MVGWELKSGSITEYNVGEDRIWSLFNYVFSDSSRKRNTYKFGLVKSLLDNVFNGQNIENGIKYTYEELFSRFAENYWNLVIKYDLRQMRKDGKSIYSKIEKILMLAITENPTLALLEFEMIEDSTKLSIIKKVTSECKKCVVGALVKVIDKLELSTPKRENLSVYREILRREFEEDTCFYCGKKLQNNMHVDHFIPWTFVKDEKIWNFVL